MNSTDKASPSLNSPSGMKIVVTGSVAPFAAPLARELSARGHQVTLVASEQIEPMRRLFDANHHRIEPHQLRMAVDTADVTILLTGLGPVVATVDDSEALDVILTASRPGSTLIELSSFGVFGTQGPSDVDETTTPQPGPGAEAMRAAEQRTLGASDELRSVVVRAGLVYGPGGGDIVAALIEAARQSGHSRFVGYATDLYPIIHQHDLLMLLCAIVESPHARGIFHAVGATIEAGELAAVVAAAAGVSEISALSAEEVVGLNAPALTSPTAPGRISVRARNTRGVEIGWVPRGPTLASELGMLQQRDTALPDGREAADSNRATKPVPIPDLAPVTSRDSDVKTSDFRRDPRQS